MPAFQYSARDKTGRLIKGTLSASSKEEAAKQLHASHLHPIQISFIYHSNHIFNRLQVSLQQHTIPLGTKILFCHQMYTLIKAGVPIIQAIRGLMESVRHPYFSSVLMRIAEKLEAGHDLTHALAEFPRIFPALFINTVQVGEKSGRLEHAFARLAHYLEHEKLTRERLIAATRYPLLVIAAIMFAIIIISTLVVPAFAHLFSQSKMDLPWQTQLIVGLSNFITQHGYLLLLFFFSSGLLAHFYLRTGQGQYLKDKYLLKLPIFGHIISDITFARFSYALSLALKAGIPLIEALLLVAQAIDNQYLARKIYAMCEAIERGETFGQAAEHTHIFPILVMQMIDVGEETGALDELLTEVANYYDQQIDYTIKNLSTLIEPILLIGLGIMVLILALGVFLPMWDLILVYKR